MTETLRFDGKVAIVTGAGAGLGRSHALALASRGARVLVNDLGGGAHGGGAGTNAADAVVAEIRAAGGEAAANYDSVENGEAIAQAALDAFGTVDILINNAGILRDVSFQKMSEQDWDLIYRVHLLGSMRVTQAVWPILRDKQYGRIVMTTSAAGLYGNFGQANYSAAKLALVGLGQTLAEEGRARNINVNVIAPMAASRLLSTVLPQDVLDLLKPESVTALVAWLCHEQCDQTKGLFEVGAGYIGKLRWQRSGGVFFPQSGFGPEQVRSRWQEIADFAVPSYPTTTTESVAPILEGAAKPRLGGNEFIDLDAASQDSIEAESSYDERDLALYALGVGAARDALDPQELRYVYELGNEFQAVPTYAVMPALNTFLNLARDGRSLKGLNYGLDRILHGEQYTELLRPLPPKARLSHHFRFKTAYDKNPHAVVVIGCDTFDESGAKLAYNEITLFVRGAGGWGGERGPSTERNAAPDREPDAIVEERTDPNQALLYRLSGDWNPMHADPAFARAFGFDRPILHGMCTYGFVARHVLRSFASNDGRRFKSIRARFADSVFPGETLITRIWRDGEHRFVFETKVKERDKVVVSHAALELREAVEAAAVIAAKPTQAATAAATTHLTAAEAFEVIGEYVTRHPELVAKVSTVFQFRVHNPDSDWVLDLRNGAGECRPGVADRADCTLELDEEHVQTLVTRPIGEVQKLYFSGQLKIGGNLMASQKLAALHAIGTEPYERVQARLNRRPTPVAAIAPETAAAPVASAPLVATSADLFETIRRHIARNPGLGDQVRTRFQFQFRNPDSQWLLDLKSGNGAVSEGVGEAADATLELDDADFVAMSTGRADAQKLYFGGKLKISGNIMASQKLMFLQKIDPTLLQAVLAERSAATAVAETPRANSDPSPSRSSDIARLFAELAKRWESLSAAPPDWNGAVLAFKINDPDAHWTIDLRAGRPQIQAEATDAAAATFYLSDEDLSALFAGKAQAQDLFQRGRLRIEGELRLAHSLDHIAAPAATTRTTPQASAAPIHEDTQA